MTAYHIYKLFEIETGTEITQKIPNDFGHSV